MAWSWCFHGHDKALDDLSVGMGSVGRFGEPSIRAGVVTVLEVEVWGTVNLPVLQEASERCAS